MKDKPYASLVGSLMYVHVCTRPDIAYSVGILGRFQTNPGHAHWVVGKKVFRYLQKTKDYMLVYKKIDGQELVVFGFSDVDFVGKQKADLLVRLDGGQWLTCWLAATCLREIV
ncbi:secreted RxLR effector protein 161-like [Rosa chinensis]|uniref:secreted RxLR effector protein 161-like n=1 Tax=Rosa chinensis TaxID=74649 RepID=UPI001AD931DD|nr:secreted RxLR effector protein 161-like [Rosa chinensis]